MKYLKENASDWICQDEDEYVKGIFVDEYYELNSGGETVYSVMVEIAHGHRVTIKDFHYPEDACIFADKLAELLNGDD